MLRSLWQKDISRLGLRFDLLSWRAFLCHKSLQVVKEGGGLGDRISQPLTQLLIHFHPKQRIVRRGVS
jgi:hypothetical protein